MLTKLYIDFRTIRFEDFDLFFNFIPQSINAGLWWFYNLQFSFYFSLTFSLLLSHQRDFWPLFFHHLLVLLTLTVSWTTNFIQVYPLMITSHDAGDILLEAVKIVKYARYEKINKILLIFFVLIWIITRIIFTTRIFLFWVFDFSSLYSIYPIYYLGVVCGILLICLNLNWTLLILRKFRENFQDEEIKEKNKKSV